MKNDIVASQITYAILGSGRIARHFQNYFHQLGLRAVYWARHSNPEFNSFSDPSAEVRLQSVLNESTHVLLAVSDRALEEVAALVGDGHKRVHFSGAKNIAGVRAAHPLMTFGEDLQSENWYRQIPFVVDEGFTLEEILPGVPNSSYPLAPELRPLYHALCSLAGNSAFLLWQNIGESFEEKLALPRRLLTPYLKQVVENAARGRSEDFTGPVARGDWGTVGAHLHSLNEDQPLLAAYKEYLHLATQNGHPVPEKLT